MDNFIIKRNQNAQATFRTLQVRTTAFEIIKQMQADSGVTIVDLVDEMAKFCAEQFKVEE